MLPSTRTAHLGAQVYLRGWRTVARRVRPEHQLSMLACSQASWPPQGVCRGVVPRAHPTPSLLHHAALALTSCGRCLLLHSQLTSGESQPAPQCRTQGPAPSPVGWAGQRTRILKGHGEDDPAGQGPHFGSHCLQGSQASERKAESLESASENSNPERNPCRQT